ncbi:MAG: Putative activity regulator of membrane protease YbbK [Burkholderiaceae bacterium]|jgi:membrane protein implicated in regulation of membrane protease activity|nr:MAG: Putative activity regulator of membrane protease YbbK [Burkholderiaceae bacterium]
MSETTLWWLLSGAAVVAELASGTFYLLMVALGLAAGAIAAHLGATMPGQLVAAAVVGGGAVLACYLVRSRRPRAAPAAANRDVNLDIGETVNVEAWKPDGTATVKFRGATWTVVHRPEDAPTGGLHRVAEVIGSRLLVEKI